jgi:glycosyltransferase involved in cell wall biosynthesis
MYSTQNLLLYPTITIGLTSYRARETISRAIASAITQDWPNIELVIVDDCSPDDTTAVIEQTIAGVPNARLIRHAMNGGPAAARNTILAAAQGEFVVFFDDDDESRPERIRIQYETLRLYEAAVGSHMVACFASGVRRYTNGYELHVEAIGSQLAVPQGEAVADYLLFNGRHKGVFYGGGTPTCALMARRSTFEAVGGFDAQLRRVEDVDFAIRLALVGGHFIGCQQDLYRQYATEGSDKTPLMNLKAELQLVEKYSEYLRKKSRYSYARDWFTVRYYHFSGKRFRFLVALSIFLLQHPINGFRHLVRSVPGRLRHESGMRASTGVER